MAATPKTIIGFCGYHGSGKSYSCDFLHSELKWPIYNFADPLKEGVGAMFGFTQAQLYGSLKETLDFRYGQTPRYILQKVGTEWIRDRLKVDLDIELQESGLWVQRFLEKHRANPMAGTLVGDVNFPDEVDAVADGGQGLIVWINRPSQKRTTGHASQNLDLVLAQARKRGILVELDNAQDLTHLNHQLLALLDTMNIPSWRKKKIDP